MSAFCLDTSAYSNFRRGNRELASLLDRAERVGVPTVTLGELRTGFILDSKGARNEAELEEFLDNPAVNVLGVDAETSRHYAEIVADLRRAGYPGSDQRHLDRRNRRPRRERRGDVRRPFRGDRQGRFDRGRRFFLTSFVVRD